MLYSVLILFTTCPKWLISVSSPPFYPRKSPLWWAGSGIWECSWSGKGYCMMMSHGSGAITLEAQPCSQEFLWGETAAAAVVKKEGKLREYDWHKVTQQESILPWQSGGSNVSLPDPSMTLYLPSNTGFLPLGSSEGILDGLQ